jgi:hypothetical protein
MISYIVDCAGEICPSARELQGKVRSTRHGARIPADIQPNQLGWKATAFEIGHGRDLGKGLTLSRSAVLDKIMQQNRDIEIMSDSS